MIRNPTRNRKLPGSNLSQAAIGGGEFRLEVRLENHQRLESHHREGRSVRYLLPAAVRREVISSGVYAERNRA